MLNNPKNIDILKTILENIRWVIMLPYISELVLFRVIMEQVITAITKASRCDEFLFLEVWKPC